MDLRLKPQDIVVALKLIAQGDTEWTQPELARSLHLSASEVNRAVKRLAACHLFNVRERRVIRAGLLEFLVSGLRYVFPAELGLVGRGMPTAFSVSPLAQKLLGDEDGVVWALSGKAATARGRVIEPLYRNVPMAAADDPMLHEYLALADAHRQGARASTGTRGALEEALLVSSKRASAVEPRR